MVHFVLGPMQIHRCQVWLALLEPGQHEIVVERVLLVPSFVADTLQVVCIFLDMVGDPIVIDGRLCCQLLQLLAGLLKIGVLSSCGEQYVVGDLLMPADVVVLYALGGTYSIGSHRPAECRPPR